MPRTNLSLLPYYGRVVGVLAQTFRDIGVQLVGQLEDEFHTLYQRKDQVNIETKIRNVRFLGTTQLSSP